LGKIVPDNTELDIATILKDEYGIHKIAIASSKFGFVVNSFFVEKPYPTLIDVPPDDKTYLDKLQSGLQIAGHSIQDVKRIIITHPHFDHFGTARRIAEISQAEVWVAGEAVHWLEHFEKNIQTQQALRREFLLDSGATSFEIKEVERRYSKANPLARSVKPTRLLKEGDLFELSTFEFKVLKVPGHTPWCLLFHAIGNRIAFSGDFLQNITSNPLIQCNMKISEVYNSLESYIGSLETIANIPLQITLPGHGMIINDGSEEARKMLSMIDKRRQLILHFMEEPDQTPADISRKLFSRLSPAKSFNGISEITAHLEMLEKDGRVCRTGSRPVRFSAYPVSCF
jgi:glyoxylase-like metal-dependent hydrolase (beta-lactamase superfamily II)